MQKKTVLITGSTDGIGKQTAIDLARKGYKILVHGRNTERGRQAMDEIISASGQTNLDLFIADFSSLEEIRKMASDVTQRYSSLDVPRDRFPDRPGKWTS